MEPYFPHKSERKVCVTAGGMNGLWALEYVRRGFDSVLTFEPAPHVLPSLLANVQSESNIWPVMAALGAFEHTTGVRPVSVGSSYIDGAAPDIVTVQKLDACSLIRCDWLQLDLEGYEYPALCGALNTIIRCSPTIQLEINGSAGKHGYEQGEGHVLRLLESLCYREVARIPGSDVIFQRG